MLLLLHSTKNFFATLRTAAWNPRVHNFGNVGPGGWVHAQVAELATDMIDRFAYDGVIMRRELARLIAESRPNGTVVDVGCGVGTLTRELDAQGLQVLAGVDASAQMIDKAKARSPKLPFCVLNAADVDHVFEDADVAVACMLAHELPVVAHHELLGRLLEVTRGRRGEVWIVDIDTRYTPSPMMLSGEPYILDYLKTFDATVQSLQSEHLQVSNVSVVPGRVTAYVLRRR